MKFSDRLKGLREKNDMTQEQLAKVSVDQLLGTDGMLVAQAAEQYGARGAKQAQQLTDEVTGLFAGGELAQDDMDVLMRNRFIFVKNDLYPVMENIVLLHELGHDALHREEATKVGGLQRV